MHLVMWKIILNPGSFHSFSSVQILSTDLCFVASLFIMSSVPQQPLSFTFNPQIAIGCICMSLYSDVAMHYIAVWRAAAALAVMWVYTIGSYVTVEACSRILLRHYSDIAAKSNHAPCSSIWVVAALCFSISKKKSPESWHHSNITVWWLVDMPIVFQKVADSILY